MWTRGKALDSNGFGNKKGPLRGRFSETLQCEKCIISLLLATIYQTRTQANKPTTSGGPKKN